MLISLEAIIIWNIGLNNTATLCFIININYLKEILLKRFDKSYENRSATL